MKLTDWKFWVIAIACLFIVVTNAYILSTTESPSEGYTIFHGVGDIIAALAIAGVCLFMCSGQTILSGYGGGY